MGNLSQAIVSDIRSLIVGGSIQPGDKLPTESAMMLQYSVSRTVVREATSRLQAIGLVESYRGKGSYVIARPSDENFTTRPGAIRTTDDRAQLIEFRIGVEVEAASLAAARRTAGQLSQILDVLVRFDRERNKLSGAVDADFQFHRTIAIASNNHHFVGLLDALGPTMIALPQTRLNSSSPPGDAGHLARVFHEHESIAFAIEGQDPQAAAAAMRTHLAASRRRLLSGNSL